MSDLEHLRSESKDVPLCEDRAPDDPVTLFEKWLEQAVEDNDGAWYEPNAMALSTADAEGSPDCRIVLLKECSREGFVFYTNTESAKGRQLAENPRAAAVFYWSRFERQVRLRGPIEKLSCERAESYFANRPRGSQLGAIISRQSQPINSRGELESALAQAEAQYQGRDIPMPAFWGGYRLVPEQIEFWQGRSSRLHDRLLYTRSQSGWARQRLSP
ncbi:MAG: pyridoxamine 5'-phosphate oxidase [Phycisphaerae bacterium]